MSAIAAVEGNGPTRVLVLHGWALDSGVWLTTRALTNQERFTYAYVDFPGYGVAAAEAPVTSLHEMATHALSAADELGWDSFSILGHSMGGGTAIHAASLAPDRVRAVVALTPVAPQGTPFDEATFNSFAGAWSDPGPVLFSLAPHLSEDQLARLVERNRASSSQPIWEQYLSNWAGGASESDLAAVTSPALLAYGDSDSFVTKDYLASTVSQLANGSLTDIAGAGHYPMLEAPAASVDLWESALG